jgi:hypothetical protein
MTQTDLQLMNTSNCIVPYGTGCYPYTCPSLPTGALNVEKLPGGFIVTLNGRREIVATVEALADYLKRWSEK